MDTFHWLLYLTLLYVVILVIALAAGLIAIARALIITRKHLAEIQTALTQVESQTKPLGHSLQTVNTALAQTSGGLSALLQMLNESDSSLGRLAVRLLARR